MSIDKTKLKEPPNTEDNREILADTILNDMSTREIKEFVKGELMRTYRNSKTTFSRTYWNYYEETYGHCPFRINSD
jgi:hypothetical protein